MSQCWAKDKAHPFAHARVDRCAATTVEIGGEQVLASQAAAIAAPSGGATIDAEARAVIDQMLTMLRDHGLIAP